MNQQQGGAAAARRVHTPEVAGSIPALATIARWQAALNADRRENLNPDQLMHLMRIARQAGVHCVMQYICTDLGYTVPAPTDPIDAAAELRREYIEATRRLMKMAERIESLEAQASLRVVR